MNCAKRIQIGLISSLLLLIAGLAVAESITPIGRTMGKMAFNWTRIQAELRRESPTAEDEARALQRVAGLKELVKTAGTQLPPQVSANPDTAKDFQSRLDAVTAELERMEVAIAHHSYDDARKAAQRIVEIRNQAHDTYAPSRE